MLYILGPLIITSHFLVNYKIIYQFRDTDFKIEPNNKKNIIVYLES